MKRFMKGCAIAALVVLAAGAVLGAVGGTLRGRTKISEVLEAVTGGRVSINLDFGAGNWGFFFEGKPLAEMDGPNYEIGDLENFNPDYEVRKGDIEKYRLEGNVESLEIEAGGCQFQVQDSPDESFYVEAERVGKLQAYVESGVLTVRTVTGGINKWNEWRKGKVVLYVPAEYRFREAAIEMGAGILSFSKLRADQVSVDVGAGTAVLTEAEAETISVSVGAGQAEWKNGKAAELEVNIDMGDFSFDGVIERRVEAECSMGNLDLCVKGRQEDFNYTISADMGDVSLSNVWDYSGFSAEKVIDNGADKEMELKCSMGNMEIRFQE